VELVREARRGSSYARNAGIAAARGAIVAMTDDDMEVGPDWLERIVAPLVRSDVLAVTGVTLPAQVETEAQRHFETYGGFGRGFFPLTFDAEWFRSGQRAAPTWKIGGSGNAAFRAEIFAWPEIGGFDERLGSGVPTGVGEDTKLFYDILHAGYAIAYEPSAVAYHHHRASMPALRRQLYGYARGHAAYHLITWLEHGDKRGLLRVGAELPLSFAWRLFRRLVRRSRYPLRLLLMEIAGTLAGPWSLWRAHRYVRRLGRGARRAAPQHPGPDASDALPRTPEDRQPTPLPP
jgi:GT2 family glycosyltransferase